jgi:hypothetical protein
VLAALPVAARRRAPRLLADLGSGRGHVRMATIARNELWRDPIALWRQSRQDPAPRVHRNLEAYERR